MTILNGTWSDFPCTILQKIEYFKDFTQDPDKVVCNITLSALRLGGRLFYDVDQPPDTFLSKPIRDFLTALTNDICDHHLEAGVALQSYLIGIPTSCSVVLRIPIIPTAGTDDLSVIKLFLSRRPGALKDV